ncbi:UNVERIFIED_CONTAM: putative polygalacturonase [Sesamum latifolium]|uniref:Polygalacturonase n=1 Tax=Sesamum latifolium TaxID=2727402 RepID=A0AAW2YDT6_9LAMI
MRKLESSSSSSNAFSCFRHSFLEILYLSICLVLNVTCGSGFQPLIQLPSSGLSTNTSSRSKTVLLNIDDFGAIGDGIADDTKILQDVWKVACSSLSPAKIIIPAGNSYLVKPIDFPGPCQSNVTLRVSGILVAPQDPEVWDGLNVHKWLYFHGVKQLTIEGGGLIDGGARNGGLDHARPMNQIPAHMLQRLVLSMSMQFAYICKSTLSVKKRKSSGVTVIAPADSPNTDGIHISSTTHVELKNVAVGTGDDCISIVGNSSQIRIKNIVCGPGHGISIGSLGKYNTSAAVQDVIVDGAVLFNTENGVRIKTWQGGSGFARKITFRNILMHNVSNPIIIDQYYCDSPLPCLNQTSAVHIDSISFRNIKGTSGTEGAVMFLCSDIYPCTRLYLENVVLVWLSGIAKSFCWEAYGTTSGLMSPPSCIPSDDNVISNDNNSNSSTSLQKDDHAFI